MKKSKLLQFLPLALVGLAFLLLPVCLLAADASAPGVVAGFNPDAYAEFLTPAVSFGLAWAAKRFGAVQGVWLVVISGAAGVLYDVAVHYLAGGSLNPTQGFILGIAATGLHQLRVQVKKQAEGGAP